MKTLCMILMVVAMSAGVLFGQLPQYNVTMTPADYNLLYTRDIFSDSALPATFEYQGTYWNNSSIRFKGHSTRYYPKKSYRVKVPSSNLFQGLASVNFNSMYTDKSLIREKLTWDLFADMGEMAPTAHHATFTINSELKGLYLFLDKPDKYFLQKRGRKVAPLYEASDNFIGADLTLQPDSLVKLYYDKAIGNVNDYSDLEALIQAINAAPDSSFADTVNAYVDVNSVLNWFAGNILTMMGDSYDKNYFLYRDTSKLTQQWTIIPWDYDLSFGRNGDASIPYPGSLLNDDFAYTFLPLSGPSNVLKDRWLATPYLKELLRGHVDTLLQTVFTEQKMYGKIDSLAALIDNSVALDPDKWGTHQDFLEHIEALKYYVTARKNYLNKTFINFPSGQYNDVTLPVSQLNVPYHFVAYDGRQLATMWFTSMSGLDSIRIQAYPDSTPPNVVNSASERYVKRWIRVTPYPASAIFKAKLRWSYQDVALNNREVGSGVQDEHLLRSYYYNGSSWNALSSTVNAFGNFVVVDSISEVHCGAGKYFALLMSDTYTQTWFRAPLNKWQRWYDVKFADPQNGFVIGDHGTMLRTTDAGASWREDTLGFHLPFKNLAIPSINNMFAAGEAGALYHSTDTARTWTRIDLGTTIDLLGVTFVTTQIGWTYGERGRVYRTTDGGVTWSLNIFDSTKAVFAMAAFNANVFSFFYDGQVANTIDRGIIWQVRSTSAIPIKKVATFGFSVWAVGEQGLVIYSADHGDSWSSIDAPFDGTLRNVTAIDDAHVYVVGDGGKIFYTADYGANWYEQYSADTHDLLAITFTDSTHGYAVGNNGTVLMTSTSGTLTDVRPVSSQLPTEFMLYQNYPNPFNPVTHLQFAISPARLDDASRSGGNLQMVALRVYDVLGREVSTLVNEPKQPGIYTVSWDGTKHASDVYFYRLEVTNPVSGRKIYTQVNKMLLVK